VLEGRTGLGPTMLMAALLALEIRGKISQKPGRMYALRTSSRAPRKMTSDGNI